VTVVLSFKILLAKIPGVAGILYEMKKLEKLIVEVYKNNHNLLRFSSPVKGPPVLTV
jgi:hypothetical protein